MNRLSLLFFVVAGSIKAQNKPREYLAIQLDSIQRIEIIDHQNLGYDWVYGRNYSITKSDGHFILILTKQYNKPFSFTEPSLELIRNPLNTNNMLLLDKLKLPKNKDSLAKQANSVISSRESWYKQKIKLENINDQTVIAEVSKEKILSLVSAINAQKESYINYILKNLNIDSTWLANNAERLWEKYKPEGFKTTAKSKEYCVNCIKKYEYALRGAFGVAGFGPSIGSHDYPYVELKLIMKDDTVTLASESPGPFMLHWNMNNKYESFNPNISITLADILPFDDGYSNKERLRGSRDKKFSFEGVLTSGVIIDHCVDSFKKRKLKEK